MVKVPIFKGSCTAIISPFNETGIDYERLKKNLSFQYENGSSAIVVCGTTGENATISAEEHDELVRVAANECKGKMKLIVGIGSNNTKTALKYAENAKYAGADGVLMVSPYYNKTSQKGLVEHFTYVADRVDIPMILYNVPSRTGIGISVESCRELSRHPNINGIKEASGDISYAAKLISECGNDLYVWSGNDDCTVALMSLGALGVISVASNILPGLMSKLCSLCLEDNYKDAASLAAKYSKLFSAMFMETNPIPVKTAMKLMGLDSGIMRLPLTALAEENIGKLSSALREAGINI